MNFIKLQVLFFKKIFTPLKSFPICGILTPGLGPAGYLGPINGYKK